jgi:rod shape-determining protein MreD
MRNVAFLAVGLALLLLQANLFRVVDGTSLPIAFFLLALAISVDLSRTMRTGARHPRTLAMLRPDLTLPATVLLGYVGLKTVAHTDVGRPLPALVLPLVLFMGVHEYSLARGAAIAFVIGYATDVFGITPVGLYTFTYVATFVLARAAGVRLAAQTTWVQVAFVAAFAMLQATMLLVLLAIFGRDPWVPKCLVKLVLPYTIATAALAPIVFRIAESVHRATGGSLRTEPAGAPS